MDIYIVKNYKGTSIKMVQKLLSNVIVNKTENGKPFLVNDDRFLNWSHNEKYFVLAVSKLSDVGIDVENVDIQYCEALYGWVLHEEEKEMLNNSISFSEIWTRKESLLKYSGEGLTDDMSSISSYNTNEYIHTIKIDDILVSVCSKYKENTNIIKK